MNPTFWTAMLPIEDRTKRTIEGLRALTALPRGTVKGRFKITEQGEVVSQKLGLLPVAERTLDAERHPVGFIYRLVSGIGASR